jgi:hypothetical protein
VLNERLDLPIPARQLAAVAGEEHHVVHVADVSITAGSVAY